MVGAALALVAVAVVRGSVPVRVGIAVVAGGVGIVGGTIAYFFDRYPSQAELARAIVDVGVPPGFTEDRALRDGADDYPFGEIFETRSFRGPGTPDALTAEMIDRLRRSCYADAAVRPPSGSSVVVGGVCQEIDVEMTVGIESQASGVLLRFYAEPRDLVPKSAAAGAPAMRPGDPPPSAPPNRPNAGSPRLHSSAARGLLVSTRQ